MSMGRLTVRTNRARERFLAVLSRSCNVTEACRRARISRDTAYKWRNDDPDFAAAWEEALEIAIERLEAEAWRRAVEGYEGRPVVHKGRVVCRMTEYSDRLMEVLLKGHRPDKYADRSKLEHGGVGGTPLRIEIIDVGSGSRANDTDSG